MEDTENIGTSPRKKTQIAKRVLEISPAPSLSRYGRTHKPKISEDFYNIDDIFKVTTSKVSVKSSPKARKVSKTVKLNLGLTSSNKSKSAEAKPLAKVLQSTSSPLVAHVTGDSNIPEITPAPLESAHPFSPATKDITDVYKTRKFFKRTSTFTSDTEHCYGQGNADSLTIADDTPVEMPTVDVTQVFKIISSKSTDLRVSPEPKTNAKPVLKTYGNKRKHVNKSDILESFGLPDTPIFPIESVAPTEANKEIDIVASASENDVNIVDKRLLNTPWEIGNINNPNNNGGFIEFDPLLPKLVPHKSSLQKFNDLPVFNQSPSVTQTFQKSTNSVEKSAAKSPSTKSNRLSGEGGIQSDLKHSSISKHTNKIDEISVKLVPHKLQSPKQFPRKTKHAVKTGVDIEVENALRKKHFDITVAANSNIQTVQKSVFNKKKVGRPVIDTVKRISLKGDKHKTNLHGKSTFPHFVKKSRINKGKQGRPGNIRSSNKQLINTTINDKLVKYAGTAFKPTVSVEEDTHISTKSVEKNRKGSKMQSESRISLESLSTHEKAHEKHLDTRASTNCLPKSSKKSETPVKGHTEIQYMAKGNEIHQVKTQHSRSLVMADRSPVAKSSKDLANTSRLEEIHAKHKDRDCTNTDKKKQLPSSTNKVENIKSLSATERSEKPTQTRTDLKMQPMDKKYSSKITKNSINLPSVVKKKQGFLEMQVQLIDIPAAAERVSKLTRKNTRYQDKYKMEVQVHLANISDSVVYAPKFAKLRNLSEPSEKKNIKGQHINSITTVDCLAKSSTKDLTNTRNNIKRTPMKKSEDFVVPQPLRKSPKKTRESRKTVEVKNELVDKDQAVYNHEAPIHVPDANTTLIKTEPKNFKLGDLMWARIGCHPFWPCMLTKEPVTGEYKRVNGSNSFFKTAEVYHVRFFGDNGRRSWVASSCIVPFYSKDDLQNLMKEFEKTDKVNSKACIVNSQKLLRWKVAVGEAEFLKHKTVQERFDFFFDMFASRKEKKLKTGLDSSWQQSSSKLKRHSVEIKKKKYNTSKKRNVLSLPSQQEVVDISSFSDASDSTTSYSTQRRTRLSYFKNDGCISDDKQSEPKSLTESRLSDVWTSLPLSERKIQSLANEVRSESSLSDTDTMSKSSILTSNSNLSKEQSALHKRNNLFRGIARERVCQVCEKQGDVLRCKGFCNGFYHEQCATDQLLIKTLALVKTDDVITNKDTPNGQDLIPEIAVGENEIVIKSEPEDVVDDDYMVEIELKPRTSEVEIITIDCSDDSDVEVVPTPKISLTHSVGFSILSLAEKIDVKMKEIMLPHANNNREAISPRKSSQKKKLRMKHVTGDGETFHKFSRNADKNSKPNLCDKIKEFVCSWCTSKVDPPCFVCNKIVATKGSSIRQKCSLHKCGKFYHPECLKLWPQAQWSLTSSIIHKNSDKRLDKFVCPSHVCHTCVSDDPRGAISRCSSDKVVKCVRCPATYHTTNHCIPAGTVILSMSQIVCPRHVGQGVSGKKAKTKYIRTINTTWCFICDKGGDLICCDMCPTSVHTDCVAVNLTDDGNFICEDCESGRMPLYDEIVWVKLGAYRWWPAVILFPNEVPENVKNLAHLQGEFAVKFFGTHDHYWVNSGRVFLFQEGDTGHCQPNKKRVDEVFSVAVAEASVAHQLKTDFKLSKEAEINIKVKPPPFVRIKFNKPVGNVPKADMNESNATACECDPNEPFPCGPDSDCLNRILSTECNPEICPAGYRCNNQRFEKRQYSHVVPFKTKARGWGLKTLAPIRKGDFVIEYIGELIDEQEYQRRIRKMQEQKDQNYYFLTIDKDRIIDAGPKGNVARFMNHSCQPNCETQKWTVNGDTRVGLFASEDISANVEITFNYNLECIGKEKKICKCGAANCTGFIGRTVKPDESQKKPKKANISYKKKELTTLQLVGNHDGPCFVCGKSGNVGACHNKICTKYFHLECVNLSSWPDVKWVCPWHNCNVCTKRTIRCCVKCINSYCPPHSEGNVRYDKLLGFVCASHDPAKASEYLPMEQSKRMKKVSKSPLVTTEETDVTSTTTDEILDNPSTYRESSTVHDKSEAVQAVSSTPVKAQKDNKNCGTYKELLTLTPIKCQKDDKTSENCKASDSSEQPLQSVTSTPIKRQKDRNKTKLLSHNIRILDNIPVKLSNQSKAATNQRGYKRKKGKLKQNSISKRIKLMTPNLTNPVAKTKPMVGSLLKAVPLENEIKLSSSVPARHLRTTRNSCNSTLDFERLLKQQNNFEKDLPIRKRTLPRCKTIL